MTLQEYRRKRVFTKTAEPRGGAARRSGRSFVVQKHAASRLHYDLRLELDGVLLSWALPKGPSLDPREKRLAVHVEDHPLEYGDFEGTIPAGEYGGGTVMVWDRGEWTPQGDAAANYRRGKLSFTLAGEKLQGDWTLVRMHGRDSRGGKENWLLMKSADAAARKLGRADVLTKLPNSVKSGRSLDEIAAAAEDTTKKAGQAKVTKTKAKTAKGKSSSPIAKAQPTLPDAARRARFPAHPKSQLATLVAEPPAGDAWLHEIKFDGYRMFCQIHADKVRFVSRNGKDWTDRPPSLQSAAAALKVEDAVLDGEVVVLDEKGASRFQLLQNAIGRNPNVGERRTTPRPDVPLHYYVFDLLFLDGHDLTRAPLEERKAVLQPLLGDERAGRFQYSEHFVGDGERLLAKACGAQLEGIISKRRAAKYAPGRGTDWVKSKCKQQQEFVVGGYSDPGGSRSKFGALLLGYYQRGKLTYAGRVGTGFTQQTLRTLHPLLEGLSQKKNPFQTGAEVAAAGDVHWVRPQLVAQIEFANWTDDGLLRQPSFQGLRDDKPARAVRRERPRTRRLAAKSSSKSARGAK